MFIQDQHVPHLSCKQQTWVAELINHHSFIPLKANTAQLNHWLIASSIGAVIKTEMAKIFRLLFTAVKIVS